MTQLGAEPMAKPNWKNRTLIHGDNLDVMRGMNAETVDLIATDPPFNKSREFCAAPDSLASGATFRDRWSWDDDVQPAWIAQLSDVSPLVMQAIESARAVHSEPMGAYLCFVSIRLLEMRRLLKPTGSIYLHCDPTASHYLKACMDAVFEWRNFLGEIVWNKQNGVKAKRHWGNENDVILCYAADRGKHVFDVVHPLCRKPYADLSLDMHFTHTDEHGRRYRKRRIGSKEYIYFADEGRFIGNLWNDVSSMSSNSPMLKERTGYPTQKPVRLYERIVAASSNEGDMVVDPFAGCATTCIAAEHLGRQWIGIDSSLKAHEVALERFRRLGFNIDGQESELAEGSVAGTVWSYSDLPIRTDTKEGTVDAPAPARTW